MADENDGEAGQGYQLLVKEDGDLRETSKHFDGLGLATHLNGDTYDGSFIAGKRDGYGTYIFAKNGDQYSGNYQENRRHGLGKFIYSDRTGDEEEQEEETKRGGTYHGLWADSKREGGGTFYYPNGDTYSGDWNQGRKHGKGTYRYAVDGSTLSGRWENGYFVQGKWTLPSGVFYVGSFKWNQPIGQGVWVFQNGNQLLGTFTQVEEREEEEPPEDPDAPVEIKPPKSVAVSWTSGKPALVHG